MLRLCSLSAAAKRRKKWKQSWRLASSCRRLSKRGKMERWMDEWVDGRTLKMDDLMVWWVWRARVRGRWSSGMLWWNQGVLLRVCGCMGGGSACGCSCSFVCVCVCCRPPVSEQEWWMAFYNMKEPQTKPTALTGAYFRSSSSSSSSSFCRPSSSSPPHACFHTCLQLWKTGSCVFAGCASAAWWNWASPRRINR